MAQQNYPCGETRHGNETARYVYRDADGFPLYRVIRMEQPGKNPGEKTTKSFPTQIFNKKKLEVNENLEINWEWGSPQTRVPYNLPRIVKTPFDNIIHVTEGEGCADALFDLEFIVDPFNPANDTYDWTATCNWGGVVCGWTPDLNQWFENRIVVIHRDNDRMGKRHARSVLRALNGIARRVVIIGYDDLPEHGDVKDFIKKQGSKEIARERISNKAQLALEIDILCGMMAEEEINKQKNKINEKFGLGRVAINKLMREWRKQKEIAMKENNDDNESSDGRVDCPCPMQDDEKLPINRFLDEILMKEKDDPFMRNIEGKAVIKLRELEPIGMHTLRSDESTEEAPPKVYSFETLNDEQLEMQIEKHVRFYKIEENLEGETYRRAVALPLNFVKSYALDTSSLLPRAAHISTLPILLLNGKLLAENGLNKDLKTFFKIDEKILNKLPMSKPNKEEIIMARDFLFDEWLCDVMTEDKYAAIGICLTILERAMLPERPVFWVTAGKRGGGKTTLLHMISAALIGVRAPATAWSEVEEERRKTIFSLARQALSFVVWDNIPFGKSISCPHIERYSTSEESVERVLGGSEFERVACNMINVFTGNNCGPKGELCSRSIRVKIDVKQADPENRPFKHPDPIEWTKQNRSKILAALYTVLLGNGRLEIPKNKRPQHKTRFPYWYELVGSALENLSIVCDDEKPFDCSKIFEEMEREDDDRANISDVLMALNKYFPNNVTFSSADVMRLISTDNNNEDIENLKNYFAPSTFDKITKISITKSLKQISDRPERFGDYTLVLKFRTSERGLVSFQLNGGPRTEEMAM